MSDQAEFEPESITFIRKTGELNKLLKRVDRISPEAIALLEKTMNDESKDLKLRIACANDLISYNIDIAKIVNNDALQRMIAQIKIAPGGGSKNLENKSVPKIDFDTVVEL
jgi:hypothetical protein